MRLTIQGKWKSNVVVLLALSSALLSGLLAARNHNALVAFIALMLFSVAFFSRRVSNWEWALLMIGAGVSLGRLYIVLGPNPLNTGRLQQMGLIALAVLGFYSYLVRIKSGKGKAIALPRSIMIGMAAYLFSYAANAIVHWEHLPDWSNFRGSMEGVFFAPLAFFIAFLLYRSDKHTYQFLWACYLIGILQALLVFLQMLFPSQFFRITESLSPAAALGTDYFSTYNRVNGVWQHAPALGAMMAMVLVAGIYLTWQVQGLKKWLVAFGSGLITIVHLATASLTPIIGGVSAIITLLVLRLRERIWKKIAGFAVSGVVLVAVALSLTMIFQTSLQELPFVNRFFTSEGGVFGTGGSYYSRLIMYEEALRLWGDNFWWGIGVGQFRYFQRSIYDLTAHSVYFQTLSEMGIIGVIGLLILIASIVVMDSQVWLISNAAERNLYLPVMLLTAVLLEVSIFDFAFNSWNFQILFWFSQGILAAKLQFLQKFRVLIKKPG